MTFDVAMLPVAEVRPYERNPRHNDHAVEAVARSIREFGWRQPIVIDEDNVILVGHTRLKAALLLGEAQVPVHRALGLSAAQKMAYRIADNKVGEAATWDDALLAGELETLRGLDVDLTLTGFSAADLVDMLDPEAGQVDPDEAPLVPAEPTARPGDIWQLGPHRVLCGDATVAADLDRLVSGIAVDLTWTDPPYNVDYDGRAGKIANDAMNDLEFRAFITRSLANAARVMRPGGSIYVAHADGEPAHAFRAAFRDAGFKCSGCLIWRKDAFTLSRSDYQWQHEPIIYGWKPGAAHRWFGGRKQSTVSMLGPEAPFEQMADGRWRITIGDAVMIVSGDAEVDLGAGSILYHDKPRRSDEHPTMKPVGLVERMLRNSGRPGDVVLDLFGGSGSTLIAAHRLGMKARLIEIDPRFVDVIVLRYENYSGERAVLTRG